MDSVKPMPRSRRAEKIAVLVVLAAILVLFAIFWKSVLFPLIRLEMKHDLAGAQRLLADNGAAGALSVVLIEAMQMLVVFIPAEFIQISSALSYPIDVSIPLCDLGVGLGASIIFLLVRRLGFSNSAYEKRRGKIERLSSEFHERNTVLLLYLLFFMPYKTSPPSCHLFYVTPASIGCNN